MVSDEKITMIEIRAIKNVQEWDVFLKKQLYTLFVQSSKYGKFYEAMGERSWIFGVYENNELMGGTLVVSTHAKRGNFLYIPYGPIVDQSNKEIFRTLIEHIRTFAKKEKYDFIRVSPFLDETTENEKLFRGVGFRPAPMHILAETTWLLDLSKSEEELLMAMNKNHRNLIRRCQKEGVGVEKTSDPKKLGVFNKLHDLTVSRHNFSRFSSSYVEKEFGAFAPENTTLFIGHLPNGDIDATAIVMYYGTMACYRHGASAGGDRRLPTSYIVQWEAILEAKRRGMKWYNFWGIAPEGAPKSHPFFGITHFKKGFGGSNKNLLHCQDLPLSWKYVINWIIETSRRKRRGF